MIKNKGNPNTPTQIITLAGNPNVGKSTIFNYLTGLKQHTGNWTGKTVANAVGRYKNFYVVDIPGTYSLLSNSPEEEIARNFLCFEKSDYTIVVCDATNLERNLNLVLQIAELNKKTAVCINMIDESVKRGIHIDVTKLSELLGLPVFKVTAKTGNGIKEMIDNLNNSDFRNFKIEYDCNLEKIINRIEPLLPDIDLNKRWIALRLLENHTEIIDSINKYAGCDIKNNPEILSILKEANDTFGESEIISDKVTQKIYQLAEFIKNNAITNENKHNKDRVLDKIFTGKYTAIPCMIFFLGMIIWLTVKGANYPSELLSNFFTNAQYYIIQFLTAINIPKSLQSFLIDGIYKVTTWVISVMLPPMAIFFPLFTIIEDFGYLPRIAFNLDKCFACSNSCGKQALTTCMGLGCNAVGVTGCRIIDSTRERLIAIMTNCFVPCNGRFPSIILILTIFFSGINKHTGALTTLYMLLVILAGILMTFLISYLLSKTLLKGTASAFILELPSYRTPQPVKIIVHSLINRTLSVLLRAICVAVPCGALIWILTNTSIKGISVVTYMTDFLGSTGKFIGLDGIILCAFILGLPANEIILPLVIMLYSGTNVLSDIGNLNETANLLILNGWTIKTALCYIAFTLFHWPCSTTLLTVYKETKSIKWTSLSLLIPTTIGFITCMLINLLL